MMHFNDKTNKIKPIQQKQRELSTKLIELSRLVDMMCKKTIQPYGVQSLLLWLPQKIRLICCFSDSRIFKNS